MIKRVAVVGAGAMGNGIAHVFALKGYTVSLVDHAEHALDKAMKTVAHNLSRQVEKGSIKTAEQRAAQEAITTFTSLKDGAHNADLVIEAVNESAELKHALFQELDSCTAPAAILASNTSSISITKIASATTRPDRVVGMHFMNPVPIMPLVEVIRGYKTSDDTCKRILQTSRALGKTPVEVNDYPGFVANRILMPMINEAICALHEGVSGVREIDTVMKLGMAHPMGPLQLADFIGLDVCLSILEVLYNGIRHPKYAPCPLLVNMVQAGYNGIKSGRGFYDYAKGDKKELIVADEFMR